MWQTQGQGSPLWSYALTDADVTGARLTDFFLALQYDSDLQMSSVWAFTSTSSTPLWNYTIMAFSGVPDGQFQLQISDDAKVGILGITIRRNGQATAQVMKFTNMQTASPSVTTITIATAPDAFIRDVQLASYDSFSWNWTTTSYLFPSDGSLAAVQYGGGFAVVDLTTNSIRYGPVWFGVDSTTLCMSSDGGYVAYGYFGLAVVRWNGKTYVPLAKYACYHCDSHL